MISCEEGLRSQDCARPDVDLMATLYLRGLRYLGFTGHSLEEGVEGVEDPGAEEAEDLGTHNMCQVGLKTQGLMKTQWLKTQRLKTKNRGQLQSNLGLAIF